MGKSIVTKWDRCINNAVLKTNSLDVSCRTKKISIEPVFKQESKDNPRMICKEPFFLSNVQSRQMSL